MFQTPTSSPMMTTMFGLPAAAPAAAAVFVTLASNRFLSMPSEQQSLCFSRIAGTSDGLAADAERESRMSLEAAT